jgi:hypothetical protein
VTFNWSPLSLLLLLAFAKRSCMKSLPPFVKIAHQNLIGLLSRLRGTRHAGWYVAVAKEHLKVYISSTSTLFGDFGRSHKNAKADAS